MNHQSFISFVFRQKKNRNLILLILLVSVIEFTVFKFFYPFADYFPDTSSYIYAASAHLDISIWPIGYSKFLLAFHQMTHSDVVLVDFQFFLMVLSCLYFFFSILYFYTPGILTRVILFLFLFLNPLLLYLCNHITSDSLFAALSICWLTELLWIIFRPSWRHVFIHAVLLFMCFTIRNNAYYYPILAIIVFALSKKDIKWKLAGVMLPFVFILPFIIHTRNKAKKLTGEKQFSLFTGWQLANNALYMYNHIQVDSSKLPSTSSRELDRMSRKAFSHVGTDFDDNLAEYEANFFIKEPDFPLRQYYFANYQPANYYEYTRDWGKTSLVFGEYGEWLIRNYPFSFVRYFILLNIKNYFFPGLEKLSMYNKNEDKMYPIVQDWFDHKIPDISAVSWTIQGKILFIYPYLFFFMNMLVFGSIIWLWLRRKTLHLTQEFKSTLLLSGSFLFLNFCFCVLATIIVLRYEIFPMLIALTFPLLLIDLLDKRETSVALSESVTTNPSPLKLRNTNLMNLEN